jgi:hypothetical protein
VGRKVVSSIAIINNNPLENIWREIQESIEGSDK